MKSFQLEIEDQNKLLPELIGKTIEWARENCKGFTHLRLHRQLWLIQGGRCAYCGCRMQVRRKRVTKDAPHFKNQVTVDHIRPAAKGHTRDPSNIIGACHSCNIKKADKDAEHWIKTSTRTAIGGALKRLNGSGAEIPDDIPEN